MGAKWRHPITGVGVPDAAYQALLAEAKQKDREEENRLWYVAMTRAEERLYLTYADRKQQQKRLWPVVEAVPVETRADQLVEPPAARSRSSDALSEEIVAPPRLTGQYDSSAAVTSVALFHACPRKYYLGGYLGLEGAGRGGGAGAIELGQAVHRILAGEDVDHAEARELDARFTASDLGKRAARATRIEREFDFLLPVEDTVLRGQIDLWFEDDGELVLVDYKTDREESPEQYALQLRIYALALERYAGRRPDRAWLYYLRSNRALEVDLTGAGGASEVVREFLAAQDAGEFPIRPGEQCMRCEFHHGPCPAP
jgi:ATP-dependent exoDNAse (exonuclease V) beta subunit